MIKDLLEQGKTLLCSNTASLDAELLLAYVLKVDRIYLKTWPNKNISPDVEKEYYKLIKRRKKKEPIAYITNSKHFWDYDFYVNNNVLIPRPETEHIIELVQKIEPKKNILELGAGSGAVILTIAKLFPDTKCVAVDNSIKALEVVNINKKKINVNNVKIINSNWFENINETFDIIISNPPYIGKQEQIDLEFEPKSALISNNQGFYDLEHIIENARAHLKGTLILEHGYKQGPKVRQKLSQCNYNNITTYKDLAGHERITMAIF